LFREVADSRSANGGRKEIPMNNGKIFLGNAFSLQMLDLAQSALVSIVPVEISEVSEADFISAIGHADTARVVSGLLGREVECQRINVRLQDGDILYVAQVTGGRLPEGATELPPGIQLRFLKVTLQ
jgi:hypothetical protein